MSFKTTFKTVAVLFCGGFLLFGLAGKANAATYFVAKTASGTGSAGANTNTGKDNVGFGITSGGWDASTKQLTKAGAFTTYTPAATDYIYVSSTTAGQAGLYSNITKISADVIQLGTLVEGTGIATNQADVSSSNGPWITIKYAVDTVPVGVQTIRVGAGTYDQGAASLSLTAASENGKTLTLIGAIGGDNIPNDTIITGSLARAVIYNVSATTLDIDFQNFTITQANAAPNFVIEVDPGGSNNMRFTNCIINGPSATAVGIEMYPVGAATTRGLYVTSTTFNLGPTSNGIRLYDAGTVVISGCSASGMGTFLQLYTGTAIGDITVTGCHITNSVGAFFASGVAAATTINSITLSNNTISTNSSAIFIPGLSQSTIISNNTIVLNTTSAIHGVALGIDFDNAYPFGPTVEITGNHVSSGAGATTKHGVFVGDGVSGAEIANNYINILDQWALVIKSQNGNIHNNVLVGSNPLWLSTKGQNNTIKYNTLYATANHGLSFIAASGYQPSGNTITNNIIVGNTGVDYIFLDSGAGSHYNNILNNNLYFNFGATHFATINSAIVDTFAAYQTAWQNYPGAPAGNEQRSTYSDPKFTNSSGQDYTLQSTSPAIDSATTTIYTADYLGNTFYGTPDIGAYEYQPPHDIAPVTPDTIDIGAGARIYGDGKFRDLGTINGNAAHLKITPSGGSFDVFGSTAKRPAWLDVTNITNWSNTHKTWTESNASSSDMVTDHTIGDLHANKYYTITITGATASDITGINGTTCNNGVCQSDGSGNLSFRYTGGYSNHTFDMFENPTAPTAPVLGTPTTVAVPLSWTAGGGTETVYVLEKSLDGGSSFVEVATVNVPTTNYTFTGLSPNNLYQFRVAAGDGVHTTSTYATSSLIYTLANQASAPTLSTATTSTIPLYINANGNPIGTTYAVYDATDSRYFTSAGAITATPTFFTSSSWSGITRGLNASSYYTFQVIARNGDGVNSATSSGATAGTASVAVNLSKTIVYTNEGIATDTYTIVLNSQPTSTVQILISPDSSSLVSPSTINFTPANWSTPVTVTVTAVVRNQGGHLSTITHTASSIVAGYRNVTIASVTNSITARTVGAGGGGGGGGLPPVITHYESGTSDPNRAANLANLNSIGLPVNSLVKLPDDGNGATQEDSAVYYIGSDGKRHAFPNSKIYFTWYSDFSGVRIITADQLASIPLGTNVRYKPGSRMVKFTTDLKVYAVDANGVLRWVKTEAVAKALYGDNWNTFIDDLSDAFFSNYSFGSDINSAADFNVSTTMGLEATISDNLVKKASS